ncbi:hypothetical protein R6Q59_028747 [Mikania micrantha]
MYGGSGKLGRGRGGGPANRNIHSTFQPSSVQRPSAPPGGGRKSAGGGHRNRSSTPAASAAVSTTDETFSLVRKNALNFGMIIKLSPVLVEEIKRLEAQGGAAKIKFDSSAKNPAENVIDVGGKEFRFTWSQETGDLCDIYEERQNGDNGDGLLVESGGAWRKINVQRELDDTVKNRVKMRTVEAERNRKSKKAIILEHGNPSMKTQMKALAAAEVNNVWRGSYKQKKEPPFKKMKAELSSASLTAVVPPKSGGTSGFSLSTPSKIRTSVSPLLTPEKSGLPLSPLRNINLKKAHTNRDDATLTQSSKGNASTSSVVQNKSGSNQILGNKPTDLQGLLISLLMEKPHGMNLKALEKAVGETTPKSVKQIEAILKKIAVFQAPGRYILKPDVGLESFKKSLSECGSSPENNNHLREGTSAPKSGFLLKAVDVKEFEEPAHQIFEPYEDLTTSEKIDIDGISPDVLNDKKVSHNNEGPSVSSSMSGSDSSDSDSSDSESDSRSPVGNRSGSGSDSDSDASANSKQGSDEDVDIMSDDDKEPKQKLQPLDHELGYAHNMADEKDDYHGSDLVDIEKDLFEYNDEAALHVNTNNEDNYAHETTNLHLHRKESEVYDHAKKVVSKTTFKRGSIEKHFDENGHVNRLKSAKWARPDISRSPDGPKMMSQAVGDMSDYDYENDNNHEFLGNSTSDSPRLGPGSIDLNAQANPPVDMDNIDRFSEMDLQGNNVFLKQNDDKFNFVRRAEDSPFKDKRPPKNSGGKFLGSHQKHGALIEKIKEPELLSTSQIKDSPVDLLKPTLINGCRPTLVRELSDLEMGEFRENMPEVERFERNSNSFKKSGNISSSDYWNLGEREGKPNDMLNLPSKVILEERDDFTRFNGKQSLSRLDHVKARSKHYTGRLNDTGASTLNTDGQRKVNVDVPRKHEKQVVPISTKDKKRHKFKDLGGKKKDFWMVNSGDNNGQKRDLESCSDDSISSYTKYEKEEPEMKGPIRDISQYNEYVQEYREKYDCYYTLNRILESYRNEFQGFGRDLELTKGRDIDKYNKILKQLMESYHQCGKKHKRLKKIFVVLHYELQHLKEMIRDFAEKQTKG